MDPASTARCCKSRPHASTEGAPLLRRRTRRAVPRVLACARKRFLVRIKFCWFVLVLRGEPPKKIGQRFLQRLGLPSNAIERRRGMSRRTLSVLVSAALIFGVPRPLHSSLSASARKGSFDCRARSAGRIPNIPKVRRGQLRRFVDASLHSMQGRVLRDRSGSHKPQRVYAMHRGDVQRGRSQLVHRLPDGNK